MISHYYISLNTICYLSYSTRLRLYLGLMHFYFFILNVLLWTILGIIIGTISLQGHKRKENKTLFLSTLSTLLGGSFAFAAHGMWVELGIDFFNLFVALLTGVATVYTFVPERRETLGLLFERGFEILKTGFIRTQGIELGKNFPKNITSTLIPR